MKIEASYDNLGNASDTGEAKYIKKNALEYTFIFSRRLYYYSIRSHLSDGHV